MNMSSVVSDLSFIKRCQICGLCFFELALVLNIYRKFKTFPKNAYGHINCVYGVDLAREQLFYTCVLELDLFIFNCEVSILYSWSDTFETNYLLTRKQFSESYICIFLSILDIFNSLQTPFPNITICFGAYSWGLTNY